MTRLKITTLVIFAILVLQGCAKKEAKNDTSGDNPVTITLDGKNFKSVSIDNFDNIKDTGNWNIYPGGSFLIDTANKFQGKSSVSLKAVSDCFILEKIQGVPVDKDKIYVIHFYYKLFATQVGETGYCAGNFLIWLKQGDETVLMESCQGIESWTEKYFYFQPKNNVPVKIEHLVGPTHGVWLDNLIVFEQY